MTKFFYNDKYKIAEWERVHFRVENQSMWSGENIGYLVYKRATKEWVIFAGRSGIITIDKGYDAYSNSIESI